MLPDYPELKRKLQADLNLELRLLVNTHAPMASRIRAYLQMEGDKFTVETTDGRLVTKPFRRMEAKFGVPSSLSSVGTHEKFLERASEAAKEIARQSEGILFSTLDEETRRVGNVLDAKGKSFDPNLMWDAVQKIDLDFDERTGHPKMPTVVVHPDMLKAIAQKLPDWERDPALRKRQAEVLAKKKDEWRDRESRRKLVG